MKTLAKIALLLTLALPTVAAPPKKPAAPKGPSWQSYSAPNGAFTAQFPGTPQTSTQQNPSPVGQVVTNMFTCPVNYGSFTVTYSDLPGIAASFAEGKCFDGARDGLLQDAKAQAVSYTDWSHNGDDAKDLVYKSATLQGHSWLIMQGSRMWVVDARTKIGTQSSSIDPFFKSFTYAPH